MPVSKPRKRKRGNRRSVTRSDAAASKAASQARAAALARGLLPGAPTDRRALERELNAATRELLAREGIDVIERESDPALERAQELVYDAWETDGEERIELAMRALDASPDCADAYVILAEAAPSLGQALEAYALGVRAGERALGAKPFEDDAGHFWGILETRGYMRARAGLAGSLWALGEREAAIAHFRELLRLNPNDNQGTRHFLLDALLVTGRGREAEDLLERSDYRDDASCEWAYGRALLRFREEGDSSGARTALAEARKRNPHVIDLLVGTKRLPDALPQYLEIGGESEAISYAAERAEGWEQTSGALDWLRNAAN